jgi:perosamine synthetase
MSLYRERFGHRPGEFAACEDIAARSLALPFVPEMAEAAVGRVTRQVRHSLSGARPIRGQPSSAGSARQR